MCARPRAGAAKEATRGQSQLQMAQPQCSFPRWPARRALRRSTARPGVSSVLCPVAGALGASTHLHGGLGVRLRHLRHLDGKRIHDGAAHVGTDELLVHHGLEHAAPSRQAPRGQFSKSVFGDIFVYFSFLYSFLYPYLSQNLLNQYAQLQHFPYYLPRYLHIEYS